MTKAKPPQALVHVSQRGRPSLYTEALASEITDRLSTGEALSWICRDAHMPAVRTVNAWTEQFPAFSASFARSRKEGFNAIAERCRETARGRGDSDGDVQRDRLIIDTDLKLLARWWPQLYGVRAELALTGDPQPRKEPREMSDAELEAAIAQMTDPNLRAIAEHTLCRKHRPD